MRDFGYFKRGQAVNEAQTEIHAAFKEVVSRDDESDPKTRRWLDAIEAFGAVYSRVYPEDIRLVKQGALPASEVNTADILDFLEADPVFFRSGYMKEMLLGTLKKRTFDSRQVERVQTIILDVIRKSDRREFGLLAEGSALRRGGPPDFTAWVRFRERQDVDPLTALLALADALPPAAMACFPDAAPISTVTWSIDLLAKIHAVDGWYLLRSCRSRRSTAIRRRRWICGTRPAGTWRRDASWSRSSSNLAHTQKGRRQRRRP